MTGNLALPTGRRGQAYAAAGLLVLVALVWCAGIGPLLDWYGDRMEAIERQQDMVDHLSALATRLPALEKQLAAGAHDSAEAERITDARAGADLQQHPEAMAATAGAHLSSVEFLQPEQATGYRRISLRVSISARWPVVISLLAAIEMAAPDLLVDDLHVRAIGTDGNPTPSAEVTCVIVMLRTAPASQDATPRAPA